MIFPPLQCDPVAILSLLAARICNVTDATFFENFTLELFQCLLPWQKSEPLSEISKCLSTTVNITIVPLWGVIYIVQG